MSNMVVATNIMALNSHRNLKTVGAKQSTASARLSSGYRINSAADDAAGLAISEKMRSQIRGLDMASKNSQDGVSLIQTAEGGMQEIDNMLQRIRELVVQVSNDTNENNFLGTGDRQKIQDEIDQLVQEIDSMSKRVEFNNKSVIDGSYADVGLSLEITKNQITAFENAITNYGVQKSAVQTASQEVINHEAKITSLAAQAEMLMQIGSSATHIIAGINSLKTDLISLKSDLGKARETYELTKIWSMEVSAMKVRVEALSQIKGNGNSEKLYFQIGANAMQGLFLNIGAVKTDVLGIGDGYGTSRINLIQATGYDITGYLSVLDRALTYVTTERAVLGAVQNRLEYTQNSLEISSENLSASESRIRDTDMAKEMMKLTSANVLQQAATTMLAQANQAPQSILQLLQ